VSTAITIAIGLALVMLVICWPLAALLLNI
jgi:hypothetical protein